MSTHGEVYELLFQIVQPGDENHIVSKTSVIEFPAHKTVAALEKAMRQEFPEYLSDHRFDLWMLDPKLPSKERQLLKTIKFPSERLRELDPAFRLADYWQQAPASGFLHFVVELRLPSQERPPSPWHYHGSLDEYQSRARIKTSTRGSFLPHSLLAENRIFPVDVPRTRPDNSHEDGNIAALRQAKATLGKPFLLPVDPDPAMLAIGTSLQNEFFGGAGTHGRRATKAELSHYHHVAVVEVPMERFLDGKQAYVNWTYLMPVASELSCQRYGLIKVSEFVADKSWPICLYPCTPESSNNPAMQYKYQPRSDFQIRQHGIPQVLVEIQSKKTGEDRIRMLLQGAAVVRVVQHGIKSDAAKPHILIAYYITNELVAQQYILCVDPNTEDVFYSENTFDLTRRENAFKFLLELYNCRLVIDSDESAMKATAKRIEESLNSLDQLPSFTGGDTSNKKRKTSHGNEGTEGHEGNKGGLLAVPQLQSYLSKLGYLLESPRAEGSWSPLENLSHPSVVAACARDGTRVMIKRAWSLREAQVQQCLASTSDVRNHTMNTREILEFQQDTLLVLPRGIPLPSLRLDTPLAIFLAEQLIEGVGFMHSHGFVHLDLKPNNLVVISNLLKIIDFGLSRKVARDTVLKGYRGTRPWVAPELGTEDGPEPAFHPIPADLWAVGRIISRFFGPFLPPGHYLFHLASQLMSKDPQSRPRLDDFNGRPKKRTLESLGLECGWSNGVKRRHLIPG
ncbi:hypothetical protein BT69DRAFT_1234978 [Atractiella rhizophila]|nr:hypothetical protein BT69DRAFT_1234978 [Atractiella rhizophila]